MSQVQDLLLEIGSEELPPLGVEPALEQLEALVLECFRSNRIGIKEVKTFGTPRRLVIQVTGCAIRQTPESKDIMGPAKRIAYDEGAPTKALLGFLKRHRLGVGDVSIKETPRGEYVTAKVQAPTQRTVALLPALLPDMIARIQFQKQMRWEASGFRFARPIRWIVCLWGTRAVRFTVAGIRSGRLTYGHRTLSPGPHSVRNTKHYFTLMKRAKVIVDHRQRRQKIDSAFRKLTQSVSADTHIDAELVAIVNQLVEIPQLFIGHFRKGYLELPREVLSTSMAQNQRIFSLVSRKGKPLPYFVGIANGGTKGLKQVRKNFEGILEAKLSDSKFFFDEDRRSPLADKVPELKRTTFEKQLGTLYDKSVRVQTLALQLGHQLGLGADEEDSIKRAAQLCKADLTTLMVSEFPNLQGVMGREYALADGESRAVSDAIFEHYLPRFKDDVLPKTSVGRALSIADKVDTLVGFFGIGKVPTGSFDPYALRRQAQGIVSVILAIGKPFSLHAILTQAESLHSKNLDPKHRVGLVDRIMCFLKDRLIHVLNDRCERFDIIDAVLSSFDDDLVDITRRVSQLQELSSSKGFEQARTVVERTHNIIQGKKQEDTQSLNPRIFQEPLEEKLYEVYCANEGEIRRLIEKREYRLATVEYGKTFFDVIHVFFDKVLVNAKEDKVRRNRIALLETVNKLYTDRIADLSKIVISREGRRI